MSRSLFVVGDDAQSIYAFRGSKIEIILGLHKHYPNLHEIVLNQNYRSNQKILDLAEKVISHNPKQKKKGLFTENQENIEVSFYHARNQTDEGEYIVRCLEERFFPENKDDSKIDTQKVFNFEIENNKQIKLEKNSDPVSNMFDIYLDQSFEVEPEENTYSSNFNDYSWLTKPKRNWNEIKGLENIAVLYRTHAQTRALEEVFIKNNLPYKIVSGTKFLDRKEIKDVLSILKFINNGEDKISFARFLPLLVPGIGPKTLQKILNYNPETDTLPDKILKPLTELLQRIDVIFSNHESLIDMTKSLVEEAGYVSYLKKQYPNKDEFLARMENVGELYSLMLKFEREEDNLKIRLENFLNEITLMTNQDDDKENTSKIQLLTLHQSKGLEFDTVFLVGIEDNILPHSNSFMEPDGIDEEVRLAYVGVTRAKQHLHLTAAQSRVNFGQIQANQVSRIFKPFLNSHTKQRKY